MRAFNGGTWTLVESDCIAALRKLSDHRFDSVVTDPPYELGFMGKKWDATGIAYSVELWREVLRVLKPGGHLLAFGGTRTYHRMACAIEDAGFEVRDSLHWMYGTGFPKSLTSNTGMPEGQGTAMKPGHEPIVMARKPLEGTVAANVQKHGTGGLNIDGCRIGEGTGKPKPEYKPNHANAVFGKGMGGGDGENTSGRWPANVLLDEAAAAELDAQSGTLHARGNKTAKVQVIKSSPVGMLAGMQRFENGNPGDSGGASRFFYVAKPSRKERDLGCEWLAQKTGAETVNRKEGSAGLDNPRAGAGRTTAQVGNYHPTVKPIELMRYLVRLVTPPGGIVLDPFTGSGTTGMAAILEGAQFVGIEREAEYFEISKARLTSAALSCNQIPDSVGAK